MTSDPVDALPDQWRKEADDRMIFPDPNDAECVRLRQAASELDRARAATHRVTTEPDVDIRTAYLLCSCGQRFLDAGALKIHLREAFPETPAPLTREQFALLVEYVVDHAGDHDDDCPEDATCECSMKPRNDAVNAACRYLSLLNGRHR
jgi:hypothetical protein